MLNPTTKYNSGTDWGPESCEKQVNSLFSIQFYEAGRTLNSNVWMFLPEPWWAACEIKAKRRQEQPYGERLLFLCCCNFYAAGVSQIKLLVTSCY